MEMVMVVMAAGFSQITHAGKLAALRSIREILGKLIELVGRTGLAL